MRDDSFTHHDGTENLETLEIIGRAKNGDHDAMYRLYVMNAKNVHRYLLRHVVSGDIVEDLVQEVFLRAFKSLDRYHEQNALFSAWLYGIARNVFNEYIREKKKQDTLMVILSEEDEKDIVAYENVEDTVELRERIDWLLQAWQRLDLEERDLLRSRPTRGPISRARYNAQSKLLRFYKEAEIQLDERSVPEPAEEQPSQKELILQYLPQVKKNYREHLQLHVIEKWSYHEIAEYLDEPVGTVKSYVKRGKEAINDLAAQNDAGKDIDKEKDKKSGYVSHVDYAKIAPYLEQLNEIYQRPIQLRYRDKRSFPEIAQILARPLGTVKSQVKRGMALVDQLMAFDIHVPDHEE